jgi:chromate transporter
MNDTTIKASVRKDDSRGSVGEVFTAFLKLGLTSFGGPIAHLGYFRDELVVRRRWIDEQGYADLVALCQFLPGPASSQVGFALGLLRGGPLGAAAAWAAFTLPSAILLVLFALGAAAFGGPGSGIIHGLKVVAVAIVAQAVWGMARNLCPDKERASISLAAVLVVILAAGFAGPKARRSQAMSVFPYLDLPVRSPSRYSAFCFLACPSSWPQPRCKACRSSIPSSALDRLSSAAAMWCCRCSKPRLSNPAG